MKPLKKAKMKARSTSKEAASTSKTSDHDAAAAALGANYGP